MLIGLVNLDRLCGSMKIQNIISCDLSAVFKEVYIFKTLDCWERLREMSRKLIFTKCGDDYDSKTI